MLGLDNVKRLVTEAIELGFTDVFFTGGEPFILKDIYEMLSFSSARVTPRFNQRDDPAGLALDRLAE